MNIAVEGCLHGQLDKVYDSLKTLEEKTNIKIDALIICGDFQAIRDNIDLDYMHCPPKYKSLGTFHKYFTGQVETPYLTIFIGGNHQAVNYMRDLHFGGWVAPKIYFLGQAGSIFLRKGEKKIRISGLSGIYNDYDFKYCLRTERVPLMGKSKISCYHVKQLDMLRLELLGRIQTMKIQDSQKYGNDHEPFDIFLSHDWPQDIALYGQVNKLYQQKPFLKQEIQDSELGSPPAKRILTIAKPNYWFSAHMHVKYAALFPHQGNKFTHFLSLDKCLKNKSCIQIINLRKQKWGTQQSEDKVKVQIDRTWLKVLMLTIHLQNQNRSYYKFEEKKLKILDPSLVNTLIEKYSSVKNDKKQWEFLDETLYEISNQKEDQSGLNQTKYLIQAIDQAALKYFLGIIFQRDQKYQVKEEESIKPSQTQKEEQNDQIQLDL